MNCPDCGSQQGAGYRDESIMTVYEFWACGRRTEKMDSEPVIVVVECPKPMAAKPPNDYGFCPRCGAKGNYRDGHAEGEDKCEKGHWYPSKDALVDKPPELVSVDKWAAKHSLVPSAKVRIKFDDLGRLSIFKHSEYRKQVCMQSGEDDDLCGLHCPLCMVVDGRLHLCHQQRLEVIDESPSNE